MFLRLQAWLSANRWHVYGLLVLLSVVPLLLFLYSADRLLRGYTTTTLSRQSRVANDLVARLLEEHLGDGEGFVSNVAREPELVGAWRGGDGAAMARFLRQACGLQRELAYCGIHAPNGAALASFPAGSQTTVPAEWYGLIAQHPRVYVSPVYQPSFANRESFIAVVAPLPDAQGKPAATLVAMYSQATIKHWLTQAIPSGLRWITVVDQKGKILLAPEAADGSRLPADAASFGPVRDALAGRDGSLTYVRDGGPLLVTYHPIPMMGWAVLVQVPSKELDKAIWQFEKPLALAGLVFVVVAIVFGNIGAWLYRLLHASEQRLRRDLVEESERKYRQLFDLNPQPMWVYDFETLRFLDVNASAIRAYGYSREEFLGMTLHDIRPPEDVEELQDNVAASVSRPAIGDSGVWKHCTKDGRVINVEIKQSRLELEGRQAGVMVATDVTEKRLLEDQFRQAQKMEAVGRLAGGIAHDFNNILGVIIGHTELLQEQFGPDDPQRQHIDVLRRAAERAAGLTAQLLAFSRQQVVQPRVLNLHSVVEELASMLRHIIGEDIELVLGGHPPFGSVKADPGQIEQVLMNLSVNARDAMPRGGKLIIEVSNAELDETFAHSRPALAPGQYVLLSVSDTGSGIDAAALPHIFEPFFTTKGPGKGTGLGLSTVYGVVQQSAGTIWVYSEPGKGTTFKIYLPRVTEPLEAAAPATYSAPGARGSETILVVEDDEPLRKLALSLLRAGGYNVLEAQDGRSGIAVSQEHRDGIDLLLTDVIMPGMSGRELAERLAVVRPKMKILYMSGYTDDLIAHHEATHNGAELLQKPFTRSVLLTRVRDLLDS